jgi:hypothetical protein
MLDKKNKVCQDVGMKLLNKKIEQFFCQISSSEKLVAI